MSHPIDIEPIKMIQKIVKISILSKCTRRIMKKRQQDMYVEEENHIKQNVYTNGKNKRVFADSKENHGMRFTRLKRLERNQHESLIIFSNHNLKKLLLNKDLS